MKLHLLLAGLFFIALPGWAHGGAVTYTTIQPPPPYIQFQAGGLNNAGEVVGTLYPTPDQGAVYNNGAITTFSLNPAGTTAFAINDQGDIVGNYGNPPFTGYLLSKGVATPIQVPGAQDTVPLGINNAGQVVGWYQDSIFTSNFGGFIYDHGAYKLIDYPGASATVLWGINNLGQVIGGYGSDRKPFIYENGIYTPLALPAGNVYIAMNDNGQIVGNAGNSSFLFEGTKIIPISVPGAWFTRASGINDAGQISGSYGVNPQNLDVNGFITNAQPVPEPNSLLLFSSTLGAATLAVGSRFGRPRQPMVR